MILDLVIKLLATAFITAVLSFWGMVLLVIVYWIIYWILKLLS